MASVKVVSDHMTISKRSDGKNRYACIEKYMIYYLRHELCMGGFQGFSLITQKHRYLFVRSTLSRRGFVSASHHHIQHHHLRSFFRHHHPSSLGHHHIKVALFISALVRQFQQNWKIWQSDSHNSAFQVISEYPPRISWLGSRSCCLILNKRHSSWPQTIIITNQEKCALCTSDCHILPLVRQHTICIARTIARDYYVNPCAQKQLRFFVIGLLSPLGLTGRRVREQ